MQWQCPNVLPGNECVDPECVYCRIVRAEAPLLAVPEDQPPVSEDKVSCR